MYIHCDYVCGAQIMTIEQQNVPPVPPLSILLSIPLPNLTFLHPVCFPPASLPNLSTRSYHNVALLQPAFHSILILFSFSFNGV